MKKRILIIMLLFPILPLFSQPFAPVGAIWHYTQWTINPNVVSYKTIESVADTVINGISCNKLVEVERYFDTTQIRVHFMYSHLDRVYFFAGNEFHLLYDFGADAGDTVVLDYFKTASGESLLMLIDSTGTVMVNGQNRKLQYISCGDGLVVEFGKHVIQGIGNTYFMFPTYDLTLNGPLRCYQDAETALFFNPFHVGYGWNHQDCEEMITALEESFQKDQITVYPNPASNTITMHSKRHPTTYKIRSMHGVIVQEGNIPVAHAINVNSLPKGIYFLELQPDDQLTSIKFIKW